MRVHYKFLNIGVQIIKKKKKNVKLQEVKCIFPKDFPKYESHCNTLLKILFCLINIYIYIYIKKKESTYPNILTLVGRARAWFPAFDNSECSVCDI
jgi:hypothetical protein